MAFQVHLADDADWRREVLETPGTVQVIECYKSWCGPCKAIVSAFRRIALDLGDVPLKFYTANVDEIDALQEFRESCKPSFLFYKNGHVVDRVEGVNYPELSKRITTLTARLS